MFLVYTNNLPQGLRCNAKLFADDTSLFSTITSPAISSSSNLNEDLLEIIQWPYQWKMSSNPDLTNQAQKLFFLERKLVQVIQIYTLTMHKTTAIFLDEKFSLLEHSYVKMKKATVGINLMHKLNRLLPR